MARQALESAGEALTDGRQALQAGLRLQVRHPLPHAAVHRFRLTV